MASCNIMLSFEGDGQESRAEHSSLQAACLSVGTGAGCSSPHRLSKGFGPASLLLSRKDAELVCSSAQLPGSTGDGHAAVRGLHWLAEPMCLTLCTVAWEDQRVTASVPWQAVLCGIDAGSVVSSFAKPWSLCPSGWEQGHLLPCLPGIQHTSGC